MSFFVVIAVSSGVDFVEYFLLLIGMHCVD